MGPYCEKRFIDREVASAEAMVAHTAESERMARKGACLLVCLGVGSELEGLERLALAVWRSLSSEGVMKL